MGRAYSPVTIEGSTEDGYTLHRIQDPDDEFAEPQVLATIANTDLVTWAPVRATNSEGWGHPLWFESLAAAEQTLRVYRLGQDNVWMRPLD